MPPPRKAIPVESSTLPVITLRVMVGEALKMRMPTPLRTPMEGGPRRVPPPPRTVNPSSRSLGVAPPPPNSSYWTTLQGLDVVGRQFKSVQALPVASIVVTVGPSVDTRLTFLKTRTA